MSESGDGASTDQATESSGSTEPTEMFGAPFSDHRGQVVLYPSVETYIETIKAIKADGYVTIADLCGVDYLTNGTRNLPSGVAPERFEIVVSLTSHRPPRRIRVRVQIPEANASIPTLFDLYPGSEAMEREAFDMFGILFENHPDPTRILMPADWDGYPLRKDFGIGSVPVQFKGAPAPR